MVGGVGVRDGTLSDTPARLPFLIYRLTTRLTSLRSFSVISVFLGLLNCDMTDTMSWPPVFGVGVGVGVQTCKNACVHMD